MNLRVVRNRPIVFATAFAMAFLVGCVVAVSVVVVRSVQSFQAPNTNPIERKAIYLAPWTYWHWIFGTGCAVAVTATIFDGAYHSKNGKRHRPFRETSDDQSPTCCSCGKTSGFAFPYKFFAYRAKHSWQTGSAGSPLHTGSITQHTRFEGIVEMSDYVCSDCVKHGIHLRRLPPLETLAITVMGLVCIASCFGLWFAFSDSPIAISAQSIAASPQHNANAWFQQIQIPVRQLSIVALVLAVLLASPLLAIETTFGTVDDATDSRMKSKWSYDSDDKVVGGKIAASCNKRVVQQQGFQGVMFDLESIHRLGS